MSDFDTVVMLDWSGGNDRGATPKADAIWGCVARGGRAEEPVYLRNRSLAEDWLIEMLTAETAANRRVLVGFDFPFGYPSGFCETVTGQADPLALWDWFEARIEDAPKTNNRFDVAAELNRLFDGVGPFWGNGFIKHDIADLPRKKSERFGAHPPEKRQAETQAKGAFTLWQLSGVGSVGSQTLMGLPVLSRLRKRFQSAVAVWPFEVLDRPIAFVEIWPSLRRDRETCIGPAPAYWIKDAWQVYAVARHLSSLPAATMTALLDVPITVEGWILGLGQEVLMISDRPLELPKPAGSTVQEMPE